MLRKRIGVVCINDAGMIGQHKNARICCRNVLRGLLGSAFMMGILASYILERR